MEEAIEVWKTEVWPQVEDPRRPTAPGSASKTNYTPDLNPTEGIWSLLKRGALANLAAADLPQLVRVIKRALMKIQPGYTARFLVIGFWADFVPRAVS